MNRTTTSAATIGGAVGVIAVFIETQLGLSIPAEVAAAEATIFTAIFGAIFPR